MASAVKRVDKIRQIVRLKQVMMRWKHLSLRRRSDSDPKPNTNAFFRRIPSGFVGVYVGHERKRFLIPARFLNLPVFAGLLEKAEEEFGFPPNGGLILPCQADFFSEIVRLLEKDEARYGKLGLEEFSRLLPINTDHDMQFQADSASNCKEATCHAFTPLLQKARV